MKLQKRKTLLRECSFSGLGFKTGKEITVKLTPINNQDRGIKFIRTDIQDTTKSTIFANFQNVISANYSTTIANEYNVSVTTIEHLMFSLFALDVTDAEIHINGPEVPLLDGSAEQIIFALNCAGTRMIEDEFINILELVETVKVDEKYGNILATPSKDLIVEFAFGNDNPFDENPGEYFVFNNTSNSKKYTIGVARTFCTKSQAEQMMSQGLLKDGCDVTNALVIDDQTGKILTPGGSKCLDEAKKHKILDFLGDLYLGGHNIVGHFKCFNSGHAMNIKLLNEIFSHPSKYIIHS